MALTNLKSSLGSVGSSLRSAASNVKSSTTRSSSSSLTSGLSNIGSSLRSAASNVKSSTTRSSSSSLTSGLSSIGSSLKSAASNVKSSTTRSSSSSLTSGLSSIGSSLKSAASNIKSSTTRSSSSSLTSGLSNIGNSLKSSGLSGTSTISKVASNVSDRINKLCGTSTINSNLGSTYSKLTSKVSSGGILSSISSAFKSSSSGSNNGGLISGLINKYASKGSLGGTNTRIGSLQVMNGGTMSSILKGSNSTPILSSLKSIFDTNSSSRGVVSSAIEKLRNNISTRTSGTGVLSNLLSNTRGLLNKDGSGLARISNLNVFGGLKNLISNVKGNITGGDTTSKMDTMGVLGLSTILSGTSSRIKDSFESWKTKLANLTGSGLMSGVIESSSGVASGEMTGLFGRFRDYAQNMSNRLFGISEEAAGVDNGYAEPSVLGAYDDLDALSTEDMPGVLGATADLSKPDKSIVDLAKEVMNGKYGNGQARKNALGDDYAAVQAEINNYLKTGKWSENSAAATEKNSQPKTNETVTTQPKSSTTSESSNPSTSSSRGIPKKDDSGCIVRQKSDAGQKVINGLLANGTSNSPHPASLDAQIDALSPEECAWVLSRIENEGFGQTSDGYYHKSAKGDQNFIDRQLNRRYDGDIHNLLKAWGTYSYTGY